MTFQIKATEQHFSMMLPLLSLSEILKCYHPNESYRAVLSCGAVYYAVQGSSYFYVMDAILKCDHSNESY